MTVVGEALSMPRRGETANGDAAVVRVDGDRALLAVVDALGHGDRAAEAARLAVEYLSEASLEDDVVDTLQQLHGALRGSRGAAATVCAIRAGRVEGCGVGNVELRSWGAKVPALLSPGVLGGTVRKFRGFRCELSVATRIVMYSDGVRLAGLGPLAALPPAEACRHVMDEHRNLDDDATVVVADVDV